MCKQPHADDIRQAYMTKHLFEVYMIAIKSKFLTTLLTVTIGLAGCATTDPYTGEEKTTNQESIKES